MPPKVPGLGEALAAGLALVGCLFLLAYLEVAFRRKALWVQRAEGGHLAGVSPLMPGDVKAQIAGIGALRALELARWLLTALVIILLG